MDDYGAAKARIFENQREAQMAVLNADDPLVARIRPRARRFEFSRAAQPALGAWFKDEHFVADVNGKGPRVIAKRADLALPGAHNVENALAALAATLPLGVTPGDGRRDVPRLPGPAPPDGARPDARRASRGGTTRRARTSTRPSRASRASRTRTCTSSSAGRTRATTSGASRRSSRRRRGRSSRSGRRRPRSRRRSAPCPGVTLVEAGTLETAVEEAARRAGAGDAVLLSPACASFDQFRNFEHRGEVFETLVRGLPEPAAKGG